MSAMFVTLTFDTEHVPISRNGFMTLDKKPLQLFFKRLRKLSTLQIKYYAVGEYGGKTMRPHYHIILFNSNYSDVDKAWTLDGKRIGHSHFGNVNGASVGYTLKYMTKPSKIPMHRNDDRLPEFSLMSKGLGAVYLTDAMVRYHKADLENRMNCVLPDGKVIAMPRYYKDKIYTEQERKQIAWYAIAENIKRELEYERKMLDKYGYDLKEKMRVERDINSFQKMYANAEKARDKV